MPNLPDVATLANDLGGIMSNYAPVVDPTTDLDAKFDNASRCNVAMMTHTAWRAFATVTLAATTIGMAIVKHDALWGNASGVAPTPARTSIGLFTITWPTSIVNELNETHTPNFRATLAPNFRGATLFLGQCDVTAANVITLRVYNTSFALNDAAGVNVDLYVL